MMRRGWQFSRVAEGLAISAVLLLAGTLVLARPASPAANAQDQEEPDWARLGVQTFLLWPNGAPGALGTADADKPTLTYYAPVSSQANGTAMVVAPGGGYAHLAMNHEGRQVANWLNSLGIAAFVLKYRLGPRYHHPIELGDAQRAIRFVRAQAAEFHVQPDRIGMIGFSAGGHLTSTAATHFDAGNPGAEDPIDRASCRPDFVVLGYPVITMLPPYAHEGSVEMLLGPNPSLALRRALSSELNVTRDTPPAFIFSSSSDDVVPAENSINFYLALRKAGVPAELHVFQTAPHGVGLDLGDPAVGQWTSLLEAWLRARGLLNPPATR